jgi:hypothetical protein
VRDIRVEGVQRTEAGTIFNYLPIKVGDRVTDERISDAVKALYATGFFRDVRLEAQGDVLIVSVQERPTISSITYVGNKEFDTDTIKKALKDIGITEARIFDRSALDRAEQELKRPIHHPRAVRRERADDRHRRRSATASRSTSRSTRATPRRSRASTSSARRHSPKSSCFRKWR